MYLFNLIIVTLCSDRICLQSNKQECILTQINSTFFTDNAILLVYTQIIM